MVKQDKKQDLRIKRTKEKLAEALAVISKTKKLDDIKVSDLCNQAKVSRATFYNNFTHVTDVLIYQLEEFNDQADHSISQASKDEGMTFPEAFKIFVHNIAVVMNPKDERFQIVAKNSNSRVVYGILNQFLLINLTRILKIYEDQLGDIPLEIIANYLAGSLSGLIFYMFDKIDQYPSTQMEEFVYKITFELFYNQIPKKSLLN